MKKLGFGILLVMALFLSGCANSDSNDDYVDSMAQEHKDDSPVATGITENASGETESTTVTYGALDGVELVGYLAYPAGMEDDTLPGIVVIHEWWGLNDNIRSMADKLAAEGYRALAVDMYGGNVAETPEMAQEYMGNTMNNMESAKVNLQAAYNYLEQAARAPKIGSIGWCFGGAMSLNLALVEPQDLDAAVIYYGMLNNDKDQLATLSMPILGIFGAEDQGIPVDGVRTFESTLKDLGKDVSIHIYEGANHAFANPSGQNYQAEAAEDAWNKTVDFLAEHLK